MTFWTALKERNIPAERQEPVRVDTRRYYLDFAIHCGKGDLDIETDGDTWHANGERAHLDNLRDNDLHAAGWTLLRFSTSQVREELAGYCLSTIADTVDRLGGIEDGGLVGRPALKQPGDSYQMGLLDSIKKEPTP